MTTSKKIAAFVFVASVAGIMNTTVASAAGGGVAIERQAWSFSGPFGLYDQGQLQRGFQVYQNVCAGCHGIDRVRFRNLVEPGGPGFPEADVKALAADWANAVVDGPNDDGEMFERPPRLSDAIPGPYKNEKQARAAQNGAYPPDLSLIARARGVEYTGPVWWHPFHMLKDMATAYQEGGVDYIYALLTGYRDEAPAFKRTEDGKLVAVSDADAEDATGVERCASVTHANGAEKDVCVALQEGMQYNAAFPGHQIAMTPPLSDEAVEYKKNADGKPVVPETTAQHARDVAAFLAWAADPSHDQRKRLGWQVLLYLLITTILLYYAKKAIWKRVKH
ncbi:MAG: cytochrome c1 [Alphaproteobacteria bacterium]|nr:cytochrome c1 [Alphaproteobacteria bacterium]